MNRRFWIATAALSIILVASVALARPHGTGPWKAVFSDADFQKVMAAEAKSLQEALSKSGEKKMVTKAKVSALMMAAYLQSQMLGDTKKSAELATMRDHAVAIAKAIADGNMDDAKKLANEMTPNMKAKAGAKTEPADLHKYMDLDELMTQFKPEGSGGKAMEKKIKQYMQKRAALSADEIKDAVLVGHQTAIIAQFTEMYGPDSDMGKKTKADWVRWSKEMGELGVEAAKLGSAAKADDKAIKAAFKKLDDNCAKCHAVWREQ